MSEELKSRVEQAVAKLNGGHVEGYIRLYSPDCVFHGYPPAFAPDVEGVTQFYLHMLGAFPDAHVTLEDVIAEGDRVAIRYTFRGTNQGEFMGTPASGRVVEVPGQTILRFEGAGKCVERWQSFDTHSLLTQLGLAHPAA